MKIKSKKFYILSDQIDFFYETLFLSRMIQNILLMWGIIWQVLEDDEAH